MSTGKVEGSRIHPEEIQWSELNHLSWFSALGIRCFSIPRQDQSDCGVANSYLLEGNEVLPKVANFYRKFVPGFASISALL